jgi:hypothetical protein
MRKFLFVAIALASCLLLAGCDEEGAKRAIEAYGFSDVSLTGMPWYGCAQDDDDFYNTKFTAKAANGRPVNGVACGGPFKGWTVRITG